jgi:starvation-inducible DNA-binding protein
MFFWASSSSFPFLRKRTPAPLLRFILVNQLINTKSFMNYLGKTRDELQGTAYELNTLLANYHIYYQNLRNFHWNVDGVHFFDIHEKFEEMYNSAQENIDEIAERILTLRFAPLSNMSEYIREASIEEAGKVDEPAKMVEMVLKNHGELIKNMRRLIEAADSVDDEGTIDLIGAMLRDKEKESWMFDAWAANKLATA